MENDDRFVGTILTRRDIIGAAGAAGLMLVSGRIGALGVGMPNARPAGELDLLASPALEEGPFFVDEVMNRSNLVGETERPTVTAGAPLVLALAIYDVSGGSAVPLKGAHVDIWHADAAGVYSDEPNGGADGENTKGQKWLRGYQVTDASGLAKFSTIFPGWYPGRTAHVHIKVRHLGPGGDSHREFTSQLFFDDDLAGEIFAKPPYNQGRTGRKKNRDDGIFRIPQSDGTTAGSHLTLDCKRSKDGKRLVASFSIGLRA